MFNKFVNIIIIVVPERTEKGFSKNFVTAVDR